MDSPLPPSWTRDSVVRFTARVTDFPEHTDTNTIVRNGIWYVSIKGYAEIIPGDMIRTTGSVEPVLLGGKVVKIIMKDPTFEVVSPHNRQQISVVEFVLIKLSYARKYLVSILEKNLNEPMSSLAAGILLGVKGQMPKDFYDQLVNTGTLHIVAASGYNVSIVSSVLMQLVGGVLTRGMAVGVGVVGVVLYVLLSGASASVVRAGVMGSLTLISYYFGRASDARRLLWVSAVLMLLVSPLLIIDIGFQLSVAATAGILYLEPWMRARFQIVDPRLQWFQDYIAAYLWPTLAATITTMPIILWHFGRLSWISPLVNMLVLPLVPIIMGMSALTLAVGMIFEPLGQILAWLLYVPLKYMVWVIGWLG